MRRIFFFAVIALLLCVPAIAQENSAPLPAGVRFPAQLISKLNSKKSKVGDEVKLEVTANLRGPGGVIALPQGAKLIGTVTAVKPHTGDEESELSFLVTKAEWHGGTMALHAIPNGVTAPKMRTTREDSGSGGDSGSLDSGRGNRGARSGAGDDTSAMIAEAMAREIKGVEVRDSGDPKVGAAFFLRSRDLSLPSGVIVTLQQTEATP